MYAEASAAHAAVLRRLARGYEADPDKRRDLLQEIHLQLWLSMRSFDGRCSLRTWVYRVAHNVGASHVVRSRRLSKGLVDVEALERAEAGVDGRDEAHRRLSSMQLLELIHRLKPLDRQIMLLHLEGEPAASIAEVTGVSAANVATKLHRIRKLLRQMYLEGATDVKS